jgi:hypothetical protein
VQGRQEKNWYFSNTKHSGPMENHTASQSDNQPHQLVLIIADSCRSVVLIHIAADWWTVQIAVDRWML